MFADHFIFIRPRRPLPLPGAEGRRLLCDVGIALLVAIAACVQLRAAAVSGTGLVRSYPLAAAVAVGASATLVLRRRLPGLCLLAGLAASFASDERTPLIAAAYAVACYGGRWRHLLVAVIAFDYVTTRHLIGMAGADHRQLSYAVGVEIVLPAVLGGLVRHQRQLRELLCEQLVRAEDAVRSATRFALLEERTRLAFDIHDHVGHEATFLVLRAGTLERMPGLPPEAREAAAAVKGSAQRVLGELRQITDARRDTDGRSIALTGPTSCAEFLAGLVRNMAAVGMAAEYRQHGAVRPLPPATEQLLYRLCREAFTNAAKHAPGAPVRADLTFSAGLVSLEVRNGPSAGADPLCNSGRMGLAGLLERVEQAGGLLSVGPLPDGGFRLLAELPAPDPSPVTGGDAGARREP